MFWTIAVGLIILWMLGLATGVTLGSLIHLLYVVAVGLLVVSLSQEVVINRKLKRMLRGCGHRPGTTVPTPHRLPLALPGEKPGV